MVLLGLNAVSDGQSREQTRSSSRSPRVHPGQSTYLRKSSLPVVHGAQLGCEDNNAARTESRHETTGLSPAERTEPSKAPGQCLSDPILPGSFKRREARRTVPSPRSTKHRHGALRKVQRRPCSAPRKAAGGRHMTSGNLSPPHGVTHGPEPSYCQNVTVLESVSSSIFLHSQRLCHSVSVSPSSSCSHTHAHTHTHLTPNLSNTPLSVYNNGKPLPLGA